LLEGRQDADAPWWALFGNSGAEIQGRDPKKSENLIAVLCYFCEWFDFGVLCGFGLGVG
jgi:hypothetical protein